MAFQLGHGIKATQDAATLKMDISTVLEEEKVVPVKDTAYLEVETTREEVAQAMIKVGSLERTKIEMFGPYPTFGDCLKGTVDLPRQKALESDTTGRLIVGLVSYLIRLKMRSLRCYRCRGLRIRP